MSFPGVRRRFPSPGQAKGHASMAGSGHSGGLNLTPMIDMFTILLVFLIKSYSVDPQFLTPTAGIDLAVTRSPSVAPDKPVLIVGTQGILFEGKLVVPFEKGVLPQSAQRDGIIPTLMEALKAQAQRTQFIAEKNPTVKFTGTLILQADKAIAFASLRPILRTAGGAGFHDIKFAGVFLE